MGCEPEPQYLVNPYQGGVYGAIDQSPFVPDHPRLFGFTSLLKPLFTYTYSTTTTTSTTTSTCSTSTTTITDCSRRRRRRRDATAMEEVESWFHPISAPATVSEAAESSPAPTVESLRESRQEDLSNFGVF